MPRARMKHWPGLLLASLAFALYAYFAARAVGGCDSWTYLSQARLLRGLDVGLQSSFDPSRFPALVPLCYELVGRNFVPGMPPGFSFELALGGFFGSEFLVSPLVGAVSVFLVYLTATRHTGRAIAGLLALSWAVSPIVIWGGTQIMSDLSAACALLLAHVLLEGREPGGSAPGTGAPVWAAGAVWGASLGIRPTNALFALSVLARSWSWRALLGFGVGAALALAYWAAFGLGRYGPQMFGMYSSNLQFVTYERAPAQLWFIASTSALLFPLPLGLSLWALATKPRERLPLVLWLLGLLTFYAGWRWPYDAWWWTRHVLPAFPAILVLAAHGAAQAVAHFKGPAARRRVHLVAAVAAIANAAWCLSFAADKGLFRRDFDVKYPLQAAQVKQLIPGDALVGALNFSGPLRLYAGIETFQWQHRRAPELIDHALTSGRPVYLLHEGVEDASHPVLTQLARRYSLSDVGALQGGLTLQRVRRPALPDEPALDTSSPPAPRAAVVAAQGVLRDVALVLDGQVPAEGSAWDADGAVVLDGPSASLTIELDFALLSGLALNADGNDSYRVESSLDGERFLPFGVVPPSGRQGLSRRVIQPPAASAFRYLRFSPLAGDGSYSIAEITPVWGPWVPLLRGASGVRGDAASVVDGQVASEGASWDAPQALVFEHALTSFVVVELPAVPLRALQLTADGNDEYQLQGSYDGERWQDAGHFPGVAGFGQRARLGLLGPELWTHARISPSSGDGAYGVSEVRVIPSEGRVIDLTSAVGRRALARGWLTPPDPGPSWPWASDASAVLEVGLQALRPYRMSFVARPAPGTEVVRCEVLSNDELIGNVALTPQASSYELELPAQSVRAKNRIEFRCGPSVLAPRVDPRLESGARITAAFSRLGFSSP